MAQVKRIALVTGGNRGIGLEVCRQLAQQSYRVILTSRDAGKGQKACQQLGGEPNNIFYHPLDVTKPESIHALRDFVIEKWGRLDVLVNNAAVYLDTRHDVLNVDMESSHLTMETNLFAPWMLCQSFLPIMLKQSYGRVVNVSSGAGQLSSMYPDTPSYRLSKLALNGLTMMLGRRVQGKNVLVNAVCPGWVRTDMGGVAAPRSVEQGADTVVWLATLPDGGANGGFFRDRQRIEW